MKAPYKIKTRLSLYITFLFFCFGIMLLVLVNWQMKKYALDNAVKEKTCLKSNSNTEKSTIDFSKQTGITKNFKHSDDEMVSVVSIGIPVEDVFSGINIFSLYLCLILFIISAGLFGFITCLTRKLLFTPINNIREKVTKIVNYPESMEEQIEYPDGKELFDLVKLLNKAFSHLSKERKLAEQTLLESNIRYRSFFDYEPDGVVILDPETAKIIEFNDRACHQLGYSREEFGQLSVPDVESAETAEETRAHIQKILLTGREDFETIQRTKQGDLRDVHVTAQIIEAGGNKLYHCIWRDITERKQAEKALRKAKEKYQRLVEELGDHFMVYSHKMDGTISYVSPGIKRIFGISSEEVIGKSAWENIANWDYEDFEMAKNRVRNMLAGYKVKGFEMSFTDRDGKQRIIYISPHIAKDDRGDQYIEGILEDITERKEAEKALKESEEQYRKLINQMTAGFALQEIICDENGKPYDFRFLEVNPAFEKITGLNADMIIGKRLLEILGDTDPIWLDTYGNVALTGKAAHFESYAKEFDKYFEVIAYSCKKGQFATIFADVTIRKLAEKECNTLIVELRAALDNIKTLKGLLPICAECKKIRDDKGYWNQIENYIQAHSDALFSHAICPECMKKLYGDEDWFEDKTEDKDI